MQTTFNDFEETHKIAFAISRNRLHYKRNLRHVHYCGYCKKDTKHRLDGKGTGEYTGNESWICVECGSVTAYMQGFALNLM